jgi:hypothetical protein
MARSSLPTKATPLSLVSTVFGHCETTLRKSYRDHAVTFAKTSGTGCWLKRRPRCWFQTVFGSVHESHCAFDNQDRQGRCQRAGSVAAVRLSAHGLAIVNTATKMAQSRILAAPSAVQPSIAATADSSAITVPQSGHIELQPVSGLLQ